MEDLAAIVAVMFVAWIVSGAAFVALAWRTPTTWSRPLHVTLLIVAAAVFALLTSALFGFEPKIWVATVIAFAILYLLRRRT
jgi:hypothetical protein